MLQNGAARPHYLDEYTGKSYALDAIRWRSDDSNPLTISDLSGISKADIRTSERSIWRYGASLPVAIDEPVSLGEGCTPLIPHPDRSQPCRLKLEWFSPSGSFKDRGAAVLVSYLRQLGVKQVLEDSSGNAGAALAAYGAAAGIEVRVLAPASAEASKIAQIRAYGAAVELVPGPREACAELAIHRAQRCFYASHTWHPWFLQGTKSLGYELWEDFGYRAPDNVIIPTGAGSNVLGCDMAFRELLRSGEIDTLPRLFAVQPANCAPVHASFVAGADGPVATEFAPTIAEGTAIKNPLRLKPVLDALRRSAGGTVAVTESDIVRSLLHLAGFGIYVEPSCAGATAAFGTLLRDGKINADERTVVVLTGSGLKSTSMFSELIDRENGRKRDRFIFQE